MLEVHDKGHNGNGQQDQLRYDSTDQRIDAQDIQNIIVRNPAEPGRTVDCPLETIQNAAFHEFLDTCSQETD